MELTVLVKHLYKVDTIVDERYADYRDTQEKHGDSKMLIAFYKKKYLKAKRYRDSIIKRIVKIERAKPTKPKRRLIVDEEDDEDYYEPPAKAAKPVAKPTQPTHKMQVGKTHATVTGVATSVYTPRKEVLTSAYGLKYRHDPDFREAVKKAQKERYARLKFLYV